MVLIGSNKKHVVDNLHAEEHWKQIIAAISKLVKIRKKLIHVYQYKNKLT